MHRPYQARSRQRNLDAAKPAAPKQSRFDTLLIRSAAVGTVVLAAAGLFTVCYTVIPLYKVAALDEQVSRKELELSAMQRKLEATYSRMRTFDLFVYVRRQASLCTGLLIPPHFSESVEALLHPNGKEAQALRAAEPDWHKVLAPDVTKCSIADTDYALRDLRESDRAYFLERLRHELTAIETDRANSLTQAQHSLATADAIADGWGNRARDRINALSKMTFPPSL